MLVPGLRNTIALDFHLNESALYWTDVVEDKIYRGKLSENGGEHRILFVLPFAVFVLWWIKYTARADDLCFDTQLRSTYQISSTSHDLHHRIAITFTHQRTSGEFTFMIISTIR